MDSYDPGASTSKNANSNNTVELADKQPILPLVPSISMPFQGALPVLFNDELKEFLSRGNDLVSTGSSSSLVERHKSYICSNSKARRKQIVPYIWKIPNERKLRVAASVANTELLKRLLDSGTDPNSYDDHKRTALHLAASRGYKEVVKCLLVHKADPNLQDVLGNTPLHLAVCSASSYNFNMVVRVLLAHGARVNIKDRSGRTPLDLACSKLCMMRQRLGPEPTIESKKLFVEMTMLTNVLHKKLKELDFDELENRLRNLSTKEIEAETDNLLSEVAKMSLH